MILDASAFYAGIPFGSPETYTTTTQAYGEVRHIKKAQGAIDALQAAGRLQVLQPDKSRMRDAQSGARASGDLPQLSMPDISVLALALQTGQDIITDDYSIANAASHMGIRTHTMAGGQFTAGRWTYRCPACHKGHRPGRTCHTCGTPLRRRLHA